MKFPICLFSTISFVIACNSGSAATLQEVLGNLQTAGPQKTLIENLGKDRLNSFKLGFSPWYAELSSRIARNNQLGDLGVNSLPVSNRKLPWANSWSQRTPWGLNFELEYFNEIGSNDLLSFHTRESASAILSASLLQDPLGHVSRSIFREKDLKTDIIFDITQAQQCLSVTKSFFQVLSAHRKLKIAESTYADLKRISARVKEAFRAGAISKMDEVSFKVDLINFKAQQSSARATYNNALVELERLSGLGLQGKTLVSPRDHSKITVPKNQSNALKHLELEKFEIKRLERQLLQTRLNNGRDLQLYGGIDSNEFFDPSASEFSIQEFGTLGVRLTWNFNNKDLELRRARLSNQIAIKKRELDLFNKRDSDNIKLFFEELKSLQSEIPGSKTVNSRSKELQRFAIKRFKNGKTKYFEFLTTRNEANRLLSSFADVTELFWSRLADYLFLTGNYNQLCKGGVE